MLAPRTGLPRSIVAPLHDELLLTDWVRDGETIVLGGLFEDVDSETVTKFPLLGDLPILGAFFRNRQTSRNKDEVVFFITPHIL
jgi:type IV pilus assembly protein PilQ